MQAPRPISALSIAAPAYNEEEGIRNLILHWADHLRKQPWLETFEIVICNDGSRDGTGDILEELQSQALRELKVIHHRPNQGAAAALTTAIQNTTKEWVLLIDSDGQFPIENLSRFRDAHERSHSLAYVGTRTAKDDTLFARFGSYASGFVCNLIHGTRYKDFNSAFKLIDGRLLRSLSLEARGLNYSTEITSRILETGNRLIEVPVEHAKRQGGRSSRRFFKSSVDRFLFVAYIALRTWLISREILRAGRIPQSVLRST